MKHTPAPWNYGEIENIVFHSAAWENATDEQAEADARLIWAAPLMLAALQRITHPAADGSDLENALQVIAQATGKTTP